MLGDLVEIAAPRLVDQPWNAPGTWEVIHEDAEPVGKRLAPDGIAVRNPSFDVTPNRYVTAIICETGVARPPYGESLRKLVAAAGSAAKG